MVATLLDDEFSPSVVGGGGGLAFRAIGWASFKCVFKMERVVNSKSHFGHAYKGSAGVQGGGVSGFLKVAGGDLISRNKK